MREKPISDKERFTSSLVQQAEQTKLSIMAAKSAAQKFIGQCKDAGLDTSPLAHMLTEMDAYHFEIANYTKRIDIQYTLKEEKE